MTTRRITSFLKGIVATAAMAAALVGSAVRADDNVPRFNQMDGDQEFLTGRNVTSGQADFTDPVSATDNDTVQVQVWYHNDANLSSGQPGAVAANTKVQVMLPDYGVSEGSTTHLLAASIGADNADTVSGTIVNGVEVGQPGLRITSDKLAKVTFVPGSVKWYPNKSDSPVTLPNGQTGDAIVTAGGINLGDIQGCWAFAGRITLEVKINPVGQPTIERQKSAVNETQGNVPAHTVSANPGDVIAYTLTTKNTGLRDQSDLVVSDDIKDILEFAAVTDATTGVVNGGVISYPSTVLKAGEQVVNTFKVKVNPASQWPTTSDFVMTNVYGNAVDVPVTPPVKPLDIFLKKEGRSLSVNGAFAKETSVQKGDTLEFRLIIKNTGQNLLSKVRIKDIHDSKLQFISGTATLTRDGKMASLSDDVMTADGFVLSTPLKIGEEITVTYRMKVDTATADSARLCNDASAGAEGVNAKKDTSCVVVAVTAPAPTPTPTPTATPTPTLPQTGPADMMVALLGVVSGGATSVRYRRAKQAVQRAARNISVL